ncbi:NADPH-dependent F420 reductase [Microbacterium marinilacus]|uniref:NAD(P)-binding domain-containing protein n=1 Tax=Microbacterium marinilacus TaxID=415209 RepID=A0ABP7BFJ4_9MICO|nr:NAD(P)-binding domain-containing protein [Microbacterium marinilacus]MBY0690521.1 NAD(P)-binding domain-containing protein [Microbacterium marinilacus]
MGALVVGVIGSGNIGKGVAKLSTVAGLETVMANSRGPASLVEAVADLGEHAAADTVEQTILRADVVVLAIPFGAGGDLPAGVLVGKTVVDATNYYPDRDGHIAALDEGTVTSSEHVASLLPDARLVKGLNNIDFVRLPQLGRPAGSAERSALPIAGDDPAAKAEVTAFLDAIGFDALDLGPLAEGRRSQPGTPIYVTPYSRPAESAVEDPMQRFLTAVPVPVPLAEAIELTASV